MQTDMNTEEIADIALNPMFEGNKDLAGMTTFGIHAKARYYAEYNNIKELDKILRSEIFLNNEVLFMGGGSNLLFVNDFDGLVLKSNIFGFQIYRKNDETVFVIAGAGENWSDFVDRCIDENLAGLENLARIPGTVGAAPVQNVGAYGVEAGDLIHAVEVMDVETRKTERLTREQCRFGYRDSYFKHEGKGKYIVVRVSFRLKPNGKAEHLDYGPLKKLEESLGHTPTIREVRDEIARIRAEKLPDPEIIGSAGSFFKNPVINSHYFNQVVSRNYEGPVFQAGENRVKLSAAWLIDHAGMKGETVGGVQVYPKQPLVLVNTGNATAADVVSLSDKVRHAVKKQFDVDLVPEVNFIDTSITATILGSGTSKGVPEIGCMCRVCTSEDEHDKRLRSSVLVKTHGMNILIDPSPDFRQQALKNKIDRIDAVLITHIHYDHVGGLDDLRPFCVNKDVDIYARKDVEEGLKRHLDYCFRENPYPGVPKLNLHTIQGNKNIIIEGLRIEPIEVFHGKLPIIGFRFGAFAYITDASHIDPDELDKLYGLKVLVLNALRHTPHFAHFTVEQALELIDKFKPEQAYLTHICHDMGLHAEEDAKLPANVHLAYDGLTIHC